MARRKQGRDRAGHLCPSTDQYPPAGHCLLLSSSICHSATKFEKDGLFTVKTGRLTVHSCLSTSSWGPRLSHVSLCAERVGLMSQSDTEDLGLLGLKVLLCTLFAQMHFGQILYLQNSCILTVILGFLWEGRGVFQTYSARLKSQTLCPLE